jgi:hypothetical protein
MEVKAEWTGTYPCLCSGDWILIINGKDFSNFIPEDKREAHMNTHGTYDEWCFDDDWCETWESYEDGLEFDEWIKENEWVCDITKNIEEQKAIYEAIQAEDWRHSSCGGCI